LSRRGKVTDASTPRGSLPNTAGQQERRQYIILFTCCFALFIGTLDNTVANVALPSIQRDLGASVQDLQWIVDGYVLVRGALLFSGGAVGDRFGRRRIFQAGLILFGAGSLLCSLAPSPMFLIVFRLFQGVGGAALTPASLAVIANVFQEPRERARALGIWGATAGLSTGLGPMVGGFLVQSVGWRSVFWINIPIIALSLFLTARYMPESRAARARKLDVPGQVLMFLMLALLIFGLIESTVDGWTSPLILGSFAVSAAALAAFILVERAVAEPLLDLPTFRVPSFSGAFLVAVLSFIAFTGFVFVNTLYLQELRGDSPFVAGVLLMPATLGTLVLSPVSGRFTGSYGPRIPVTLACVFLTAGLFMLAGLTPSTALPYMLASYFVLGAGIGLVNAPITNAAVSGMPPDRAGVAGAATSTARQIGSSIGIALLGSLAFTGFTAALPGRLRSLHLPPGQRVRILHAAAGSGRSGSIGHPPGVKATPAVVHAIQSAFTTGQSHAYLVAAAIMIACTLLGASLMGSEGNLGPER
jgi:EmrB/QacA subfamily drug resistance transporter